MKKQRAFTLIELILTLVVTTILASVVVELIAGPIKTYFWTQNLVNQVEMGEQSLDNMGNELIYALPKSIQIEKTEQGQSISFRKVIYKDMFIPSVQGRSSLFSIPLDLIEYPFIYFPNRADLQGKYFQVNIVDKVKVDFIGQSPSFSTSDPLVAYFLSEQITYQCIKDKHTLERIENINGKTEVALLAKDIFSCDFTPFEEQNSKGVLVKVSFTRQKALPIVFFEPILFEVAQ